MRVAVAAVTGTRGGPRTYALALLRELAALEGPEEYVLLADADVSDAESGGVRRVPVPMPGGTVVRPIAEAFGLPLAVRRCQADVFHGTKQTLPRGIGCPSVVTIHDLAPMHFPETFGAAAGLYLRRSTAAAAKRADHIIVDSEHAARDVQSNLGVRPDRVTVVPLGVDDRFRRPVSDAVLFDLRQRLDLPERYVLCVGTIQPRKNVDMVIDAVERLRAAGRDVPQLVVAGRAAWNSADVLARAEASPHVLHRGEVADGDLPLLYAGAEVFLSPSSYEGFGLTVAEAMAAGTAVIAGRGSASDEVVGDAGLLVKPRDLDELCAALESLVTDDAERERIAEAGRRRCERFTWSETARRTRDVYRSVARVAV